ncbi:MAG: hypothetical protein AAF400_00405 [Bacteroidota bacterium]
MKFNEHQSRLWGNMIRAIEDFRKEKIQYFDLVYGLESALYAGEFKDQNLIKQWYDYWTPLEILAATKGNNVLPEDINEDLKLMESFLKSILSKDMVR